MGMMTYLLLLLCVIIYCGKIIYKNYQEERPLGYGQNKTLYFVIVLCITVGQYMIPSAVERLIAILLFDFAFFLIYTMIGLYNKKNHSGELFLLYKKEVIHRCWSWFPCFVSVLFSGIVPNGRHCKSSSRMVR